MFNKYLIKTSLLILPLQILFCSTSGVKKEFRAAAREIPKKEAAYLAQESLFLGGKTDTLTNPDLLRLAGNPTYIQYKKSIEEYWSDYNKNIFIPVNEWRKANVPEADSDTVLYSFSGPDFPNAYALFPDANVYILMGLELSGLDPDLANMEEKDLEHGLASLSRGLVTISKFNFFRTLGMIRDISGSSLQGTTPVFLTYFGLLGLEPLSIRYFLLDEEGRQLFYTKADLSHKKIDKNINVEIFFRDERGDIKKLVFLSGDISDEGIKSNPGGYKYLSNLGPVVSTMKAASYLVHLDKYSKIKKVLLDKSEFFVMDDTGPRISDLEKNWDIKVFGKYTKPIPLFKNKFQKKLVDLHTSQKPEKIKFRYGYGTYDGNQHLMIITRKKKVE